jgi:hypothetical protein
LGQGYSRGQSRPGKFIKGAEKYRFRRQFPEHRKTTDSPQRTICREPLMQRARIGKIANLYLGSNRRYHCAFLFSDTGTSNASVLTRQDSGL